MCCSGKSTYYYVYHWLKYYRPAHDLTIDLKYRLLEPVRPLPAGTASRKRMHRCFSVPGSVRYPLYHAVWGKISAGRELYPLI